MNVNFLDKKSYMPKRAISSYDNIWKTVYYYIENANLYTIIIVKFLNEINFDENDFFQESIKLKCSYGASVYKRNVIKIEEEEIRLYEGVLEIEDAKEMMKKLDGNDTEFVARLISLSTLSRAEI